MMVTYIFLLTFQYDFAKDGLVYSSPFVLMFVRYLIAAVTLLALARTFRPIINKDIIILSIVTSIGTILWILGLQNIQFSQSAVLSFTFPLFAIPLSSLILKEGSSKIVWIGAIIGFAGTVIYSLPLYSTRFTTLAVIFSVGGALFVALYAVYARKVRLLQSSRVAGTQFLLGSVVLLVLIPNGVTLTLAPRFLIDLLYVSIPGGAVSFYLWFVMSKLETVGRLSVLTFAVPAATVVVQFLQTDYVPPDSSLVGIFLVFLGIFISRRD